MTTLTDKDLLLRDLSARLPYGVEVKYDNSICEVLAIDTYNEEVTIWKSSGNSPKVKLEKVKPFLFPLSSITDEMMEELNINGLFKYRDTIANVSHFEDKNGISEEIYTYIDIESISVLIEFFHSHHIDYRGLIPKGLAIDATGLNIYC